MKLTKNQALAEILRLMRKYGLTLEEIQAPQQTVS